MDRDLLKPLKRAYWTRSQRKI